MPATYTSVSDHAVSTRIPAAPWRLLMGGTVLLLLSACANLHTIHRSTELPGNGKAIHLDSPQRVMYATANGKACTEPTPDALQSYISSFGGAFSAGPDGASVSNALKANAVGVGLHSQTITLMREHLFRICEYAQNNWLNSADIMLLMERSQNLTLGVLAIEQLTGAVVTRPATSDPATSQPPSTKVASDILTTKAELDLAMKKEEALQTKIKEERNSMNAPTNFPITGNNGTDPAAVSFLRTGEQSTSSAAETKVESATAFANDLKALAQVQAERAELEMKLDNLRAQGEAATSTSRVSEGTADTLAKASTAIVEMILNKGNLADMCITFMNHPENFSTTSQYYQDVMEQCRTAIEANIDIASTPQSATLYAPRPSLPTPAAVK